MKLKSRLFTIVGMLVAFCLSITPVFSKKSEVDKLVTLQWENPIPRFSELGFDIEEVCSIIGDGQLAISNNARDMDVWTHKTKGTGEVKTYHNTRIVTNISIINRPKDEVRRFYLDFENYPKAMPQFTEGEVIEKKGDQELIRLVQVYKFLIFTMKADFKYLYKFEKNDDLSILLIDGDVGAGVARLEFIPLDENRTLIANTIWMDLDSAKLIYRTLMKAQPDLKPTAPIGAAVMLTEQVRNALHHENLDPPCDSENIPSYPNIPFYSKGDVAYKKTLEKLSNMGTLVFVHPRQWIRTPRGIKSVEFVSSIGKMPGKFSDVQPLSKNFNRIHEYFDQAKKVEYIASPEGDVIDWNFKFGFGVVGVGIDYTVKAHWKDENAVYFEGIKGDIDPLHGAMEWMPTVGDETLVAFTAAIQISDDASWMLKLGKNVPKAYIISSLFMGTLIVEKQAAWIEKQLDIGRDVAAK